MNSALDRLGHPIAALTADLEDGFTCPECSDPVLLCAERSLSVDPYFRHPVDPFASCSQRAGSYARESFEHLRAKDLTADALREAGYQVYSEETHDAAGARRRPDLTVYSPTSGDWVAIEIQHSDIGALEVYDRNVDHRDLGAIGTIWIWVRAPRFQSDGIMQLAEAVYNEWQRTGIVAHQFGRTVEETPDGYIERLALRLISLSDRHTTISCSTGADGNEERHVDTERLSRPLAAAEFIPAEPRIVLCRDRHGFTTPRLRAITTDRYREPVAVAF